MNKDDGIKELAQTMKEWSNTAGDHHWQAGCVIEQLQAEVERLQHLLLEKFKEWQIDSGEWDEVEWLERVQVALFGKEQPEEQAKEVQS